MTTDPARPTVAPVPSAPDPGGTGYGAPTPRDFEALRRRFEAAAHSRLRLTVHGEADGYPILSATLGDPATAAHHVLLTSGVHGDEPAGVESVARFLEEAGQRAPADVAFLVLPCINPHGWVHGRRENGDGLDINRSMDETGIPIVDLLKQILGEQHFDLVLDMHEDYDGEGFYLYEAHKQDRRFGERVIEAVKQIGPVDCQVNDEDVPIAEGVMAIDPAWGTVGWSSYIYIKHAEHGIIAETASGRDLIERVAIHGCVIDESLRLLGAG